MLRAPPPIGPAVIATFLALDALFLSTFGYGGVGAIVLDSRGHIGSSDW